LCDLVALCVQSGVFSNKSSYRIDWATLNSALDYRTNWLYQTPNLKAMSDKTVSVNGFC